MEHRGGCHQLLMDVKVEVSAKKLEAKALVDTGAQTSLIRRDLLPDTCYRRARRPLLLKTASGEALAGGADEVELRLTFSAVTDDDKREANSWSTTVVVHDGLVSCDLILGYPWLRENQLDVQPWRDALQLHNEPKWILTERRKGQEAEDAAEEDNDEEIDDLIFQVQKMRLRACAGDESEDEDDEGLTEEEVAEVAEQLRRTEKEAKSVRGVVMSEDPEEHPLAQQLRQEIMEEYADKVFRDRVWPDPPARGAHGKAVLRLKPGAIPIVGRIINLRGERLEALKEMEAECLKDRKLEPGRGEWRAAAFPIKRNRENGGWCVTTAAPTR
jgi:hypothetical protein